MSADHDPHFGHDPLCPSEEVCHEGRGWLCELIAEVRADEARRHQEQLHAEFARGVNTGKSLALAVVDRGGRAHAAILDLIERPGDA